MKDAMINHRKVRYGKTCIRLVGEVTGFRKSLILHSIGMLMSFGDGVRSNCRESESAEC